MVAPTITTPDTATGGRVTSLVSALVSTDLDEFAVTLADLASAVDRREPGEVFAHLHDIALHDHELAAVLADFLACAGLLTDEEV